MLLSLSFRVIRVRRRLLPTNPMRPLRTRPTKFRCHFGKEENSMRIDEASSRDIMYEIT